MKSLILSFLACLTLFTNQNKYPDLEDGLYAEITTTKGIMVAKLNYNKAPVTVANFVTLAEGNNDKVDKKYAGKKFYNGLIFHRVINKFMIQGGDPTGTGAGDPGYRFKDEINDTKHDRPGVLSMANSGPATNSSQFFITEVAKPHLNPKHTVFGALVMGLETLDAISNVKVTPGSNKPVEDVIIKEVNIIRKGSDAKKFKAKKVFNNYFKELEDKKKKAVEQLEKAKDKFIKDNKNLKGKVNRLKSGVVMILTKKGSNITPTIQDKVLVNYAGFLEDGTLFDTNIKVVAKEFNKYDERANKSGKYKPFPMKYSPTARLAKGFREALLKMKVGDKTRIFIPSDLGYGARDYGPVPANSNLIFDIEITEIEKK